MTTKNGPDISKYRDTMYRSERRPSEYPSVDRTSRYLPLTAQRDPVNQERSTTERRGSSRKLRSYAARLLIPALAVGGAFALSEGLTSQPASEPATLHESPVASLSKSPGDQPQNGLYEVSIGPNGNVYGGLEAIARAEGKDPTSSPVSEALASESNKIIGLIAEEKVSPQSLGEVTPGTHFDVTPDSKIVDPGALGSAAPQEVITKVG